MNFFRGSSTTNACALTFTFLLGFEEYSLQSLILLHMFICSPFFTVCKECRQTPAMRSCETTFPWTTKTSNIHQLRLLACRSHKWHTTCYLNNTKYLFFPYLNRQGSFLTLVLERCLSHYKKQDKESTRGLQQGYVRRRMKTTTTARRCQNVSEKLDEQDSYHC